MAINSPKRGVPQPEKSVLQWLLNSDPSIRWQVMQDLLGAPEDEVAAERAKVTTQGWGRIYLLPKRPTGRGLARLLTRSGTPQCTFCRCCKN